MKGSGWDSNLPTDANALIGLPLDDETHGTPSSRPKGAPEMELATHCREGAWSCGVDLAGTQGFVPIRREAKPSGDVTESASQPRMRPKAE